MVSRRPLVLQIRPRPRNMFGLRKSERAAFEAHIESLNEQIHWLRSCLPWVVPMGATASARASVPGVAPPPLAPSLVDDGMPLGLSMTEEEEDVMDAVRRGDLDMEEAKAILKTLGLNDEIELA